MLHRSTLLFFVAAFFAVTNPSFSQPLSSSFTVKWSDSLSRFQLADYKVHKVVHFENAVYDYFNFGVLPLFAARLPLNQYGTANVQITNARYETVPDALVSHLDLNKIPDEPIVKTETFTERRKHFASVTLVPLRANIRTGKTEKLVSFDLTYTVTPVAKSGTRSTFATTSVLSSGAWYKFGVSADGIYKIDKTYLASLGINAADINPNNIRIYGNGGGMLPEANASPRLDDLVENAIYVEGAGDGQFNDSDFILFYGQGPHRWYYDSLEQRFFHRTNIYSDFTYYFMTVDLGPGKRIAQHPQVDQPATGNVSTFDEHVFHETESKNLLASGRHWFGEEFQFVNEQAFSFSIPNPVGPAKVKVVAASRSINASRTFSVTANGASIGSLSLFGVSGLPESTYASTAANTFNANLSGSDLSIGLNYSNSNGDATGWLDYIEINAKRHLTMSGGQMFFRSSENVGSGNVTTFNLSNVQSGTNLWDVTNPADVKAQLYTLNGSTAQFNVETPRMREFVAFTGDYLTPGTGIKIENQNLHATGQTDYVIVTTNEIKPAAQALADYRASKNNMKVAVVTVDKLYNEFSSGAQDITAIRDFMKLLYDRAAQNGYDAPKYLLLFGDASYDYKSRLTGNTNLVPTYESNNVTNPTATYCSDDYFCLLDDAEGGSLDGGGALDVAVGRMPVATIGEAYAMVNKVKVYESTANQGSWQNVLTVAADDDPNVFLDTADDLAAYINTNYPVWNVDKIYVDAFRQMVIPSGQRAPDVNTAIRNRIYNGTLLFNYQGHGGPVGLGHERILMVNDFDTWNNCDKMPLFVTATCEFSRFDDPGLRAAGEILVMKPDGGAIALVTTLRLVYQSANTTLNNAFMYEVLKPVGDYYPSLGESFLVGKNHALSQTDVVNTRKFALLGDPALTLDYPRHNVVTTDFGNHPIDAATDTMKALQKVTIKGKVTDGAGNTMTTFNGRVYPTVYDKAQTIQTFGDQSSNPIGFKLQNNILYRGKASVKDGLFQYTFVVPKDINYTVDYGKISYYAEDGNTDAHGYTNVYVGDAVDSAAADNTGPKIKLYMNDEKFARGGITDENPTIFLKLRDENGINTTGAGIGHDITGIMDNDNQSSFAMNDFYEADLDSFASGTVRYPLKGLAVGRHSLDVKCWDVYNNSSTANTEFVVATSAKMALEHVLNYPNPFTTQTEFMFEHNMPGAHLDVKVEIFTVSGKLVKTIRTNILSTGAVQGDSFCRTDEGGVGGYRVDGITWDGNDDFGDAIGKGVYVYRVSVRTDTGMKADKYEKLVVLK